MPTLGRDSQVFVRARRLGKHYFDVYREVHAPVEEPLDVEETVEVEVEVTVDVEETPEAEKAE